jgi:hypothetical protein
MKNENRSARNGGAGPDVSSWDTQETGFAPYWSPDVGKYFMGSPVTRDERDPGFVRYVLVAACDLECARGPVAGAETVLVKRGEFFTVGAYHTLVPILDKLLAYGEATGKSPVLYAKVTGEAKTAKVGQTVWTWEIKHPPGQMQAIREYRANKALPKANNAAVADDDIAF